MDPKHRKIINTLSKHPILDDQQLEQFPFPLMLINKERIVLSTNQPAKEIGVKKGQFCWDTFGQCGSIPKEDKSIFDATGQPPEGGTRCIFCSADQALTGDSEQVKELTIGDSVWETYWTPVKDGSYLHFGIQISG